MIENILPPTRYERIQSAALSSLADDEISLIDLAAAYSADLDSYKLLASVLLEHLHTANATITRQSATIVRLHQIIREYIAPSSTGRERRAA